VVELPFVSELLERLKEDRPLMQFVIGPRQVGKTTGIEQVLKKYSGPSQYKLVEGELNPDVSWLREQWQKALSKGPETLLVIDEVQKIENWAEALKSLWDESRKNKKYLKCIFLGSSSLNLQKGIHESLTGRYEMIRVFHWDLVNSRKLIPTMSLIEFLRFGGYPGSYQFFKQKDRFQAYIKDAIVNNVIEKDILLNHTVRKPALFKQCAQLLASYPAQEISYTKLLGQLQEGGNVELIKYYMQLLEGAFLFKSLQKYSPKAILKKSSSPKVFPLCPALVEVLSEEEVPRGRLLEMAVGMKLNEIADHLYYWREGSYEVDFIVTIDKKLYAVEVKSGKKKHSQSLEVFIDKNKKIKRVYIDEEEFERLSTKGRRFFEP
jgi:predicted AAA+ superfamily ATPase